MSNSNAEYNVLVSSGLKTVFVSSNTFVSPAIFKPVPESEKRFDAVYDARINPYKRHMLATEIKSLALITARALLSQRVLHPFGYGYYSAGVLFQQSA